VNRLSKALALASAILTAIGAWSHGAALVYCLAAALVLFAPAWITATRSGQTARPQVPLDDDHAPGPYRPATGPADDVPFAERAENDQHTHDDGN